MKDAYRELCDTESTIPLFSQAWWLDAVAGDNWDVVLVTKGETIIGSLPYVARRKWGLTSLTQPTLTQCLGPWIKPTDKSYAKRLSYEKDVLGELADSLPKHHLYAQNWHCDYQNWLPFYWRGFQQTTRYTYRLPISRAEEELWNGLQQNTRGDIRKARDREGLRVREGTLDEFLALNRMVFQRQNRAQPYSAEFVAGIDRAAKGLNARDCLVAVDSRDRLHAGAYVVRSGHTAYYLMGGGDPDLRNSGATSLVLWEAILRQPDSVNVFDFEGSMIEPVERFFRAFGAVQTPYFHVSKTHSRFLKAVIMLRDLAK